MATIKWETAENMMNIAAFIATRACSKQGAQIDLEAIEKFARDTFQEYCDMVGITEVEDSEEEDFDDEECDEDENEYCDSSADNFFCNSDEDEDNGEDEDTECDDDNVRYSLTAKGRFVLRYLEAGYSYEEVYKLANLLFGEGE